jgi:hypothetical protein
VIPELLELADGGSLSASSPIELLIHRMQTGRIVRGPHIEASKHAREGDDDRSRTR